MEVQLVADRTELEVKGLDFYYSGNIHASRT
jgi:hypothetical protein